MLITHSHRTYFGGDPFVCLAKIISNSGGLDAYSLLAWTVLRSMYDCNTCVRAGFPLREEDDVLGERESIVVGDCWDGRVCWNDLAVCGGAGRLVSCEEGDRRETAKLPTCMLSRWDMLSGIPLMPC